MKTLNRKELIRRLDKLRQTYARYEGAWKKKKIWWNKCVTCGKALPVSKLQGGHYIGRACVPLRWDERNVHAQCVRCNNYKNGAYIEYSQWFIHEYGEDVFELYVKLYRDWQQGKIPATGMDELRSAYDTWLARGRELEKRAGRLFPNYWQPIGPEFIISKP